MSKRFILFSILLTALFGLCFWGRYFHPWIDTTQCDRNPATCDGLLVIHFSEPMIGEIYKDGFLLLQKNKQPIRVRSDTTGLIPGEFIGLSAIYHREGYLETVSLEIARNRRYKIWLSVIPLGIVIFALIRCFRINLNPFQIELRTHA